MRKTGSGTVRQDSAVDAATLPWSWYSDPAVLRVEQERIFRRAWQYAGHTGQLSGAGTYFSCRAGDVPIVVTRDRAGQMRAFLNVCRHRGSQLVEGEGRRETLQCPYHAWTYGLDGTLRAAPRSEREDGFERGSLGLVPVAVETWGPLIFVNPDRDAAALAHTLGPLPELVASAGIDLPALEHRLRTDFALEANWKVAAENFLECYHCQVAHPGLAGLLDVSPDAYRLEADGLVSSQFGPRRTDGAPPYDAAGEIDRGQFHFLWPNLKLNIEPGQPNFSLGVLLPEGPERTVGFFDYFFAPDVSDEWVREFVAFDDQVGAEDRALVERVHRGVTSGVLAEGRLMDESERLIAHFDGLVRDALA
jgi:phenylpropionate dioxygenase-like ring-hydroxylating dioxygenase large terminal subunit